MGTDSKHSALFASVRVLSDPGLDKKIALGRIMPNPRKPLQGCPLNPRYPFESQVCREDYPPVVDFASSYRVACHNRGALLAALRQVA